jgi:hypothetical protein
LLTLRGGAFCAAALQLLKVYALARVTPAALRQLLSSMGLNSGASTATQPAAASQPAAGSATAAKAPSKQPRSSAAAGTKATNAQVPASSGEAEGAAPAAVVAAAEAGSVPPDEVLSGSNIFSTAEACLLAWMNAHAVKAFPKLVSVTVLSLQGHFPHHQPGTCTTLGAWQCLLALTRFNATLTCCLHCRTCV